MICIHVHLRQKKKKKKISAAPPFLHIRHSLDYIVPCNFLFTRQLHRRESKQDRETKGKRVSEKTMIMLKDFTLPFTMDSF